MEEHGYTGSYSIVQRYMKKCRSIQTEKANLELIWDPGPAQVDFGEADFYEAGKLCRKKYLTVSFPYSNDGYSQVFGGETAECVCQGLQDIFEFIGGVPPLLIFDNATGVGRRIGDAIHESELFSRFRAHYHFRVRFCNPYSGWEKGNVERKVDYNRANLFVPVPHFNEIEKYNQKLCFLQALFPQKCGLNSSKLHGEFPQYCISSAGTLSGAGEEPLQAYKVY